MKTLFLSICLVLSVSAVKAEEGSINLEKRLVIHRVAKGEELHLLAAYYLLNARLWGRILSWNSDKIKNKNLIYPGQEFTIYVDKNWSPPYELDNYVKSIGRR